MGAHGKRCNLNKSQISQSLKKMKGRLTYAAKDLDISYRTLVRKIEKFDLKDLVSEISTSRNETELDSAEEVLMQILTDFKKENGKKDLKVALQAAMYILNNRGKSRGYNHPQNMDNEQALKVAKMVGEELKNSHNLVVNE